LSVGTRHRSRYAMKAVAFIGPSSTKGATIPRRRRPAMKVIVFQCPCGTWSINRMPRGQRPRSRTMAVLVEVSSINTSRAGSNMPCSRIQRRRARATSARSCSAARRLFFEADIVSLEQPPDRTAAAGDPSLAHPLRRSHPASNPVARQSAPAESPRAPPAEICSPRSAWPRCFRFRASAASI